MKTLTVIFAALAVLGAVSLSSPAYAGMYDYGSPGMTSPGQSGPSSVPQTDLKNFVFGLSWADGTCMTKTIIASNHDDALSSVKKLCTNCNISDIASYPHGTSSPEMLAKAANFCPSKMY